MKIQVPSIPEEGKKISLNGELEWFQKMVEERFLDFCEVGSAASGDLFILRTNDNVTLNGDLDLKIKPSCDRCAKKYSSDLKVHLHRHLTPYFGNPDDQRDTDAELELEVEDLEFSTYQNEEIDLVDILAEEVFLSLPMVFHCQDDCAGLCLQCGANLNEKACGCEKPQEESPFEALKGYDFPSEPH